MFKKTRHSFYKILSKVMLFKNQSNFIMFYFGLLPFFYYVSIQINTLLITSIDLVCLWSSIVIKGTSITPFDKQKTRIVIFRNKVVSILTGSTQVSLLKWRNWKGRNWNLKWWKHIKIVFLTKSLNKQDKLF